MVESRSVIRNAKNARGLGRDRVALSHFSLRHRPLSQVVRVLISLLISSHYVYYLRAWHRLCSMQLRVITLERDESPFYK